MVGFHWNLNDSKSSYISRTLLSIQADLNLAVVWMVSILPLIFNCSNPLSKPWGTVPNAPTTINSLITFMFHSFCFFNSLATSKFLFIFSPSFLSAGSTVDDKFSFSFLFLFFFFSFILFIYFCKLEPILVFWAEDEWIILCLKITENFMYLIFLDRFHLVTIPSGSPFLQSHS